jgi:CHAT domain-containing protein/Tfp pilus assembly protein PilF
MANLSRPIRRVLPAFLSRHTLVSPGFILIFTLLVPTGISVALTVSHDDFVLLRGPGEEKPLAGGRVHTYRISVSPTSYLRVVIKQHGIIIMATLYDPQGKELVKSDNPCGAHGPIYVSTISQSAGDYRLEVRSIEGWANSGRYEISIEDLQPAKQSDSERVSAEKNYADGRQLYERRKYKEALEKFDAALSYWQRVGDSHFLALTEYCLAVTYRALDDRPTAAKHFDKTVEVQVDEFDWRLRATAFNDRGANLGRLGYEQKAFESLEKAFKIYQSHQDRRGQASVFNNIGFLHLGSGRNREASDSFHKALPLRREENDRGGEAILFNNIASAFERLGEPRAALEGYTKALEIWQDLNQRRQLDNPVARLATGFNNVALAYDRLGEWQQALENYEKALALYGTPLPVAAANTLDNIGELYAVLGDSQRAMEYYEKARSLAEGKDARTEANVLNHTGELYLSENKLSEALACFERTLALRKDDSGRANALTNIGTVYTLQGNPRKALESYESALKLIEGGEDRRGLAFTLQKVGEAQVLLNEPVKALDALNRALPIWRSVVDQRGEATTLYTIARAERDRRNVAEALERSKESRRIIESLRTKVASQRLRSSFFASQQSHYEMYIDLRMRLYKVDKSIEHLAATLEASEQSRTRSLIDTLTEARADLYRGVSSDLIDRERKAQERLNDKARVQMGLLNRKHSKEEAANIEREVNEAIAEYDAIKARIRASNPEYAQLTQSQSLNLKQIQQLLDDETLLLEFFLGEERSYLWVVSRNAITAVDSLPKRSEIETSALAFYKTLTQRGSDDAQPRSKPGKDVAEPSVSVDPTALSQMLLGPVADQFGKKRLLIVGDGVLQYLPFAALPSPLPQGATTQKTVRRPYLMEENEIVYLPSASVLSVLRTETAGRKPAPLSVAVLADPVFGADDERLKVARQLRSGLQLVALPATRREAEAIGAAVPPLTRTKIALGFDASRDTVMKLQDEGYRIVHFATHGDLNTEHPELSSIVLSMRDRDGKSQDGFLRLHDIYNLKLPADLIVLSACNTGLGRIIKGEGLIGLTRGFMHAGSPRVVASLWRVEDLGTSELMRRFYQHMTKEGMSPPMALRKSQLEMLKTRRWRSPYYWAGFVLQGEWKPIRSGP